MKLYEMAEKINKNIQFLIGQKLEYDEIHDIIRNKVNETFNDENIKYCIWDVDYEPIYGLRLFTLKLESIDDKRQKWNQKTKIQSINFETYKPEFANLTLDEVIVEYEKEKKKESIEYIKSSITEKEREINKLKEQLKLLEAE
jgi:hypothetical protein